MNKYNLHLNAKQNKTNTLLLCFCLCPVFELLTAQWGVTAFQSADQSLGSDISPRQIWISFVDPPVSHRVPATCGSITPVPEHLTFSKAWSDKASFWPLTGHTKFGLKALPSTPFPQIFPVSFSYHIWSQISGSQTFLDHCPHPPLNHIQHCTIWFYLKFSSLGLISLSIHLLVFQCDFQLNVRSMNSGSLTCPCCILSAWKKTIPDT